MGGGLGAIMWGADGGMGTTLMRGAGIMGGIGVRTWPGARRTTGATGGRGSTGTADRSVVRTGGANCLWRTHSWQLVSVWIKNQYSIFNQLQQLTEVGGRGTAVTGGLGFGKMAAVEGMGGWWWISLGLLGPIFSLVSSSPTSPLALWMASICSCRVMLACAACWVRAMLPEWPSHVTW